MQIKDNKDKIKLNNQLPYLVGNIVEVLEMQPEEDDEDDGANVDLDSQRRGKCVVLKTSTRQTIFLPVVGLVDADALKPADLVGVNKVDTALLLMLHFHVLMRITEESMYFMFALIVAAWTGTRRQLPPLTHAWSSAQ